MSCGLRHHVWENMSCVLLPLNLSVFFAWMDRSWSLICSTGSYSSLSGMCSFRELYQPNIHAAWRCICRTYYREFKILFRVLKMWAVATTKIFMPSPCLHFPFKDRPPLAPIGIMKLRTGITYLWLLLQATMWEAAIGGSSEKD